jgi:hypothetical protein
MKRSESAAWNGSRRDGEQRPREQRPREQRLSQHRPSRRRRWQRGPAGQRPTDIWLVRDPFMCTSMLPAVGGTGCACARAAGAASVS